MANSGATTYRYAVRTYKINHNTGVYSNPPTTRFFETKVKATTFYNKAVKIKSNRVYFFDIRKNPKGMRSWLKDTMPERPVSD